MKKMLIDAAHAEEVRVCVLENGVVEDFDFESSSRKPLRGNIYLARVTRVEPSLQAAFVEYGGNRHGFLAFNEIHPDYYQIPVSDRKLLQEAEDEEAELAAQLDFDEHGEPEVEADEEGAEPAPTQGAVEDEAADFRDLEGGEAAAHAEESTEDSPEDDAEDHPDEDETPPAAFLSTPAPTVSAEIDGTDADDEPEFAEAGAEVDTEGHEESVETDAPQTDETSAEASNEDDADAEEDETAVEEPPLDEEARREARRHRAELLERYREARRKRARLLRNYRIQEVVKRRQILLVQVVKEERGNKGAALTTYMSLAGRYCVLMPNTARGGGISRKIPVAADRKRLKRVVDSLDVAKGMGLIIRTAGAKRTKAEIKRDYEYLTRLWENIRTLTMQSIAPCLIYEEANLIKRAIRDLYDKDIGEVQVEGDAGYREAKDFMKMLMPSHAKNVQPYKEKTPLFIARNVESQLDAMYQPTVRLKSGGYIVIHQTEALVAIDVNSGKATRERNIELTALKTNLEAAREAARQCRLRDLAGLIVIDFIDMEESRNNRTVEKRFKEALRFDRARLQVGRISNFGLLEMSRQRRRSGIVDGTTHACPTCNGAGVVRSAEMAALRILRAIEREALSARAGVIAAECSLDVTLYILNHKREWLKRIEDDYALTVEMIADTAKAGDAYEIEKRGPARDLPSTAQVVRADQTEDIEVDIPQAVEEADEEDEADAEASTEERPRRETSERDENREDGARRRRRRRGRGRRGEGDGFRRGGSEESSRPEFKSDGADAGSDHASADAGSESPDGDEATDDRSNGRADAERGASEGRDDNGERRRRRRGRRGGRRNRGRSEGGDGAPLQAGEGLATDGAETARESDQPYVKAPVYDDSPRARESVRRIEIEAVTPEPIRAESRPVEIMQPAETAAEEPARIALPDTPPKAEKVKKGWWQRAIGG